VCLFYSEGLFPFLIQTSLTVYALYERNQRLLTVFLSFYVSGLILCTIGFCLVFSKPIVYNASCDPKVVIYRWAYTIPALVFDIPCSQFADHSTSLFPFALDIIMLAMTLLRVIQLSRRSHTDSILRIILRDGLWAVFIVWSK
jgi:hypothetical protein